MVRAPWRPGLAQHAVLTLRAYQTAAVTAAEECEGRVLIVLPTGAGKTVCFAHIIAKRGGDALVLAHRDELLEQAAKKIVMVAPELSDAIGMVKGKRNDVAANVVVGSVQTLARARRLTQLRRVFRTVIVDEAHHATAASYQRILEHVGESAKILGFTATAERSDGSDLRGTFDTLGYARSLKEMIAEGYLCDLRALRINLDGLDLRGVRKSGGDYRAADLGRAMQNAGVVRHVVACYQQHAAGKKTVAFFPTVATSQAAAAAFREAGFRTAHLDGKTPTVERRGILGAFACGHVDIVTNVGVLCLDAETEILTDKGWTGPDEMSTEHLVANWWSDGTISWHPPREIVHRERGVGERMVYLETRYRSLRVTEGHRMLHRCDARFPWAKSPARDLVGKSLQIPVSGRAEPRACAADEPCDIGARALRRRISANAYTLRTRENYAWDESFAEGERRVRRRLALRHKAPTELTREECWLIGFWIGDGGVNTKHRGGREYTLSQSTSYPAIIDRVDHCLRTVGLHFNRRRVPAGTGGAKPSITWTLPRGTGFGSQERVGVYAIEKYLDKDGTDLFWGFDEARFDALLEGLWFADGDHGAGKVIPKTLHIHGSNATLFDLLQAIAVCRGYRAHMHRPKPVTRPYHTPMRELVLRKEDAHRMSSRLPASVLRFDEEWRREQVWCVRTTSSNLITRRRGTVTVMGNSEGYDEPSIECIILAAPTRSQIKFTQMVGRGTRLYPGKRFCLVLDMAGVSDDLSLQSTEMLFDLHEPLRPGESAVQAVARERRAAGESGGGDDVDYVDGAGTATVEERDLFDRDAIQWVWVGARPVLALNDESVVMDPIGSGLWRVLLLNDHRARPIAKNLDYGYAQGCVEDLVRRYGVVELADKNARWRHARASPAQLARLRNLGVDADRSLTRGQATDLITEATAAERLARFDLAERARVA